MSFKIEVAEIRYRGADIGNDLRASFTVNGKVTEKSFQLQQYRSWRPSSSLDRWIILDDPSGPAAVGSTLSVGVKITERDLVKDDIGTGNIAVTIPKFSSANERVEQEIQVVESGKAAVFTVVLKVTCIHKLFEKLLLSHPETKGNRAPCSTSGVSNFKNQCAIRMGLALQGAGFSFGADYPSDGFCWHGHGRTHTLRVEQLVPWLRKQTHLLSAPTEHTAVTAADFSGKLGIAAFFNFYGVPQTGDHIDVWDGAKILVGESNYFQKSEKVVFWQL